MPSWPLLLLLCLLPITALAGDGILEINATCAVQPGCFTGDAPGYPVTITTVAGGSSFRLTSDLVVPNESTRGISVEAPNTSIDLAGFSLIRAVCVGASASCVPASGTGSGIAVTSTVIANVSVRNGGVVGMGLDGIRLGVQAEVRNVRTRWNRSSGIRVENDSTVAESSAVENGATGIFAQQSATIAGNTVSGNGSVGISASGQATIAGNTSTRNSSDGIFCSEACVVSDNAVSGNAGRGIHGSNGSRVARNVVRSNGLAGISVGQSSVVEGNTVSANGGVGIGTGYLAHVVDNGLDGNAGTAIEASDGSNVSRNTVGPITASFASFFGITCGAGCAVYENVVRNTAQAMALGAGSRYGRNVLTLTPSPAVLGSGVSAGDNLCNGAGC